MGTSTLTGRAISGQTRFSRGLSLLLLVFVVYGITIQAAHRHGNAVPDQTVGTPCLSDAGTTGSQGVKLVGCDDCLICQLHLNFSTTVLTVLSSDSPLPRHAPFSEALPVSVHSQTTSTQTGRAPPLANS